MTGVLAGLPEALKKHLEALMALENRVVEGDESRRSPRWTGSVSTSGWSWRSRCAGSPARCTAG